MECVIEWTLAQEEILPKLHSTSQNYHFLDILLTDPPL